VSYSYKETHNKQENKMLEKLRLLKNKFTPPTGNELILKELKTKKLQIKNTILNLARKKSIHRKKRYHLRTKRLSRIASLA
jgi:hypothetical protein